MTFFEFWVHGEVENPYLGQFHPFKHMLLKHRLTAQIHTVRFPMAMTSFLSFDIDLFASSRANLLSERTEVSDDEKF